MCGERSQSEFDLEIDDEIDDETLNRLVADGWIPAEAPRDVQRMFAQVAMVITSGRLPEGKAPSEKDIRARKQQQNMQTIELILRLFDETDNPVCPSCQGINPDCNVSLMIELVKLDRSRRAPAQQPERKLFGFIRIG